MFGRRRRDYNEPQIILPPRPMEGEQVRIPAKDYSLATTRIRRNGNTIEGRDEDLLVNSLIVGALLIFEGGTWRAYMRITKK